ncbi:MAG: protoporphyrinogen oxidase [Planctomycetota bacterium]
MPSHSAAPPRVAVIGAGITGLAAAHRLVEISPELQLTVYESSDRAGGVLQTVSRDGFLIERSADNFLVKTPWAIDLCRRLGIVDDLLPTDEKRRKALVIRDGKVVPAPVGFVLMSPKKLGSVLASPVLSWRGKLRLLCEPFIRRGAVSGGGDESVASFARRRLGNEVFDRLVQPLLAGIYTADPDKLSMAATMPQFVEQEKRYGSLCRAAWKEQADERPGASRVNSAEESGARYGLFLAPRNGIQQLVDALVDRLPSGSLRLSTPVESIQPGGGEWLVRSSDGEQRFEAVLMTAPAHYASRMLAAASVDLSAALGEIQYAGCSIVCLAFHRDQIGADLPGFGFVVPTIENRQIIAASFSSLKFPGRAPDDQVLIRVFVGGALQPKLAELADDQLRSLATSELQDLLAITGEPSLCEIARWPRGMPQYHVGHLDRVERIEALVSQQPGLEIAGAAYRGVGIPQCIHGGEQAAERLIEWLGDRDLSDQEKMPGVG